VIRRAEHQQAAAGYGDHTSPDLRTTARLVGDHRACDETAHRMRDDMYWLTRAFGFEE